ncbi:amino acid-binding protein [Nocardioides cremeus]|uniref:Amino acid-binding protein n=1 Tax=Nocardioides cremeus TaxID=3058044 RepID=A0ABT8TMZ6_9ACTN|nr:amino acid-binding protein [Nocardioides cremeus]MDO3395331.1 amino acid-binding protein [Nocardioides cremeus]
MSFLLRVELPDVPGSLGRLATRIGEAGGDIEAIEIVEKRDDVAVDDVLLELVPGTMPDTIVSACHATPGVRVLWISRYAAGGQLFLDLEAVEELTANPKQAINRLVDLLPVTFRADWAARVHRSDGILHATDAAPADLPFVEVVRSQRAQRAEIDGDDNNVYAAVDLSDGEVVLLGRRGGPEFLDSELARVGHLAALAVGIARP